MDPMSAAVIALLVLVSVLAGALLPLILQARTTLRSVQAVLDEGRPKLLQTLDELSQAAHQVKAVAADVEEAAPQITAFLDTLGEVRETIEQVQGTVRSASTVAAAIGPAVAAAVQAFRAIRAEERETHRLVPDGADEPKADDRHARYSHV